MKIIFVSSFPASLINFRAQLIDALSKKNDVVSLSSGASKDEIHALEQLGSNYVDYPLIRNGLNPFADFISLYSLIKIFRKESPDIILAYTIKPIIWGGIASRFTKKSDFHAMVTGLGYAFQRGSFLKNILIKVIILLYKIALKNAKAVIFQNPDNMQVFIENGIVCKGKCHLINGSGVDISHFEVKPLPSTPKFLLIARLLGDKGIREYVKAANIVKQKYPDAIFQLVGPEDPSPDGISLAELTSLNHNNLVDYLGGTNDVRPYIEACSIFVLPSYHEGLPRTVLEAMATGRPILTTDVPGCRETVINSENGWLVEKANVEQLVERMIWFIEKQNEWQRMAQASRAMVEDKFDVYKVNADLMEIMELTQ